MWVLSVVVGIEERFRGGIGAEKLGIRKRISMTKIEIFL